MFATKDFFFLRITARRRDDGDACMFGAMVKGPCVVLTFPPAAVPVNVMSEVSMALLKINTSHPAMTEAEYVAVTPPVSWFG
jgi:hypothetical protein